MSEWVGSGFQPHSRKQADPPSGSACLVARASAGALRDHFIAMPMSSSTNDVCRDAFSAPVNLSVTVLPM